MLREYLEFCENKLDFVLRNTFNLRPIVQELNKTIKSEKNMCNNDIISRLSIKHPLKNIQDVLLAISPNLNFLAASLLFFSHS